jgi:hypothetical protein
MLLKPISYAAICLVLTFGPFHNVYNQSAASLTGVVHMTDDRPAAFVNVVIEETQTGAVTDEAGQFKFTEIDEGQYTLTFSFIGFEQTTLQNVIVKQGQLLNVGIIHMKDEGINLKEITVTPGSFSIMGGASHISKQTLSAEHLKNMAWAEDITRAVARLPGISSSDYSSKFAIRGGEASEVLLTLDGMELYEPFHQRDYSGGLFSIVDIETVREVDLMTGGFSADNGNRLSGIFDMKTKNVEPNSRQVKAGISIMYAQVYTDGTFAKNKGSYLASFRRGMLDIGLKAIGNQEYFPKFHDGMAKISYTLSEKHQLSFHFLQAHDQAFIDNSPDGVGAEIDQFDSKYRSTYSWLTFKSAYTPILFSRTLLYGANINHDRTGGFNKYDNSDKGSFSVDDQRDYSLAGMKQDWQWEPLKFMHFRFGFEAKTLRSDYHYISSIHELRINSKEEIVNFDQDLSIQITPKGEQIGSYLTTKIKILPKLIAEAGLRYDVTSYTDDKNVSPRISFLYIFSKRTSLRAGWGYYYQSQFINNLDVNNGNATFNSAQLAKHYVLGFQHEFKRGISLRLEAYDKDLSNVSPLWQNLRDHLENYPEARNDNARIIFNGIRSKGIELFLRYDEGKKMSWWLSYALAQATDDVKAIEFDGWLIKRTGKVPRLNDQRHTVYADMNYCLSPKWSFNASFQFYHGWPRTDYTYRYQKLPNGDVHFYQVHGLFNGKLYPAYHKLDIRVNRNFPTSKGKITAFLHIVNVYNQQNLKKFDLDTENDQDEVSVDAEGHYVPFEDNKYWLGLLPVFGVAWSLD